MMSRSTPTVAAIVAALTFVAALTGCSRDKRGTDLAVAVAERETPAENTAAAQPQPQDTGAETTSPPQEEAAPEEPAPQDEAAEQAKQAEKEKADKEKAEREEAEKAEKDLAAKHRKLAKLERDLAIAQQRMKRAGMAIEHAGVDGQNSIAKAEAELDIARRKLETFEEKTVPTRIARAELNLQGAEDRVLEAKQELEQLELMYKDEEFADKTKEIVLERGRRRLERSQRSLEIQRVDLATLTEKTIPVELEEHELRVREKHRALERARRSAESTRLDKQIALMGAESEITRLKTEIEVLIEEIADLKEKTEKEVEEEEEVEEEPEQDQEQRE